MTEHAERTVSWHPGREVRPGEVWHRLPEPGETLAGRFKLVRVLGAGSSGVVFAAEDMGLGARVAVKVIHSHLAEERSLERLRREVRAARGHHEHAVAVYDLHETDGLRFLSMELVEGASLKAVLARAGPLSLNQTVSLGRQVASALAFFCDRGLVHRDVKPGNILLAGAGDEKNTAPGHEWVAKLCDLGLARSLEPGSTVTETAMVVGTPAYMAPEQATGEELTPASDVYALGLVLWECLTGETPLRGDTAVATLVKRQTSRPPRLRSERPDAPAWLGRLLAAMLDPKPHGRPSAEEVERSLASGRARWHPPWRLVAAGLAAIGLASAGVTGWRTVVRGATVRMEAVGRVVAGYNEQGRTTWRYDLENPVQQVEHADLDGDGAEEILVSAFSQGSSELRPDQLPLSELLIAGRTGKLFTRVRPEELVRSWEHPFPLRLAVAIQLIDLDGDGLPEVLLNARQRSFFPNQVLLYWPRHKVWDWAVNHSGYLVAVAAVPDRPGQVAVAGINNRLGMHPIFAVWSIASPRGRAGSPAAAGCLMSPDHGFEATPLSRWEIYTLLPAGLWGREGDGTSRVLPLSDGTFEVAILGQQTRVDPFGNPSGTPNWGHDLRELREEFLVGAAMLRTGETVGSSVLVEHAVARLTASMQPLLAEAPYRAVLALSAARAYARVGQRERAMAALKPESTNEDVAFRLANLEALDGRHQEAIQRARRLIDAGRSPRAGFDAQRLLLDVATEAGEPEAAVLAVASFGRVAMSTLERQPGLVSTFWGRVRLWWDEVTPADAEVRSWPFADDGDAVACLARWRLGQTTPADLQAMQDYIRGGSEGVPLGRVALAAAHLAGGHAPVALTELDRVILEVNEDATFDLRARQHQHLARALRAHALAALGRPNEARAEAERLHATSRPGLLPTILARELLEQLPEEALEHR